MEIELWLCFVNIWILKTANNATLYKGGGNGPNGQEMPHRMKKEFCDQMMGPLYVKVVFTYIYFH